ncbi:MAG: hypothetical protein HKN14_15555 [Marinicaulis sp.]|nr:hypothetical protein [Marinicaulis sp.]
MANKLLLSLLGAGLVMGLSAPAFAQSDRGRDNARNSDRAYSQQSNRNDQTARNNQRDRNDARRGDQRDRSKRQVFQTRYRATIVLNENTVRSRRGFQKVCTVNVRGPQARFVPKKRLRRIAINNCSRRASVRINA